MSDKATRRKELIDAVKAVHAEAQAACAKAGKGRVKLSDIDNLQITSMPLGGELIQFHVTFTGSESKSPVALLRTLYDSLPWPLRYGWCFVGKNESVFEVVMVW